MPRLITFIASWNNFIEPPIVTCNTDRYTLLPALRGRQSLVDTEWGALTVGSDSSAIPLIVLIAIAPRRLVAGLVAGAVK